MNDREAIKVRGEPLVSAATANPAYDFEGQVALVTGASQMHEQGSGAIVNCSSLDGPSGFRGRPVLVHVGNGT